MKDKSGANQKEALAWMWRGTVLPDPSVVPMIFFVRLFVKCAGELEKNLLLLDWKKATRQPTKHEPSVSESIAFTFLRELFARQGLSRVNVSFHSWSKSFQGLALVIIKPTFV